MEALQNSRVWEREKETHMLPHQWQEQSPGKTKVRGHDPKTSTSSVKHDAGSVLWDLDVIDDFYWNIRSRKSVKWIKNLIRRRFSTERDDRQEQKVAVQSEVDALIFIQTKGRLQWVSAGASPGKSLSVCCCCLWVEDFTESSGAN